MATPRVANPSRNRLRAPPRSAMAPRTGARRATTTPAVELAMLRRKVLTVSGAPALQNCLLNRGTNPAMTVVAKAEFAQS